MFSADILIKIQIILPYIKLFLLNALFINLFLKKRGKTIFRIIFPVFIIIMASLALPLNWQTLDYILLSYYILLLANLSAYIFISIILIKKERLKSVVVLLSSSILLISYLVYIIQNKIYIFSLSVIFVGQQDTLSYGILLFVLINSYYLYINEARKTTDSGGKAVSEFAAGYNLSKREHDILELLIQRLSYKEIAEKLFISNKTVETHIYHIYQKTGWKTKRELIDMIQSSGK